jgi:hypothetical protein
MTGVAVHWVHLVAGIRLSHRMREATQFRPVLAYLTAVLISMMLPG